MGVCIGCGLVVDGGTGNLSVKMSADACNAIHCRADGLWSPCPNSNSGAYYAPSPEGPPGGTLSATSYNSYKFTSGAAFNICNSFCCPVAGLITFRPSGLFGTVNATSLFQSSLELSTDGSSFVSYQDTLKKCHNNGSSLQYVDFQGQVITKWINLAVGQCQSFILRQNIEAITGTGTITGSCSWNFYYNFTQQCACDS